MVPVQSSSWGRACVVAVVAVLSLGIGVGSPALADDMSDCASCHAKYPSDSFDQYSQQSPVSLSTCWPCHGNMLKHGTALYDSPYGSFTNAASINLANPTTIATIHSAHRDTVRWTSVSCVNCHRGAACGVCHGSAVPHGGHTVLSGGGNDYPGRTETYSKGTKGTVAPYTYAATLTCTNASCHGSMNTTFVGRPSCINCHSIGKDGSGHPGVPTDPQGSFQLAGGAERTAVLVGILIVYFKSGLTPLTFDIPKLWTTQMPVETQRLAFAAFFIGFAVKVPIVPFHTWLPDAYQEAPTVVTIMMAGALAAMGTYGFLRLALPILPKGAVAFGGVIATLAVVNAIYGDLVASAQRDLKRMAAYSSISHMGFATLGIMSFTTNSIRGASLHMFNHGIIMGMFFLCVGLIHRHFGTREIGNLRAILSAVPLLGAFFWLASLASFGMPGTSGFVGELWIFLGSYQTRAILSVTALLGAVIMAGYMFWMLTRVSFGDKPAGSQVADIGWTERLALAALGSIIIVLGFYPLLALSRIDPSVPHIVARIWSR